jgi:hypothetical protein
METAMKTTPANRLPYGARSVEEMERNLAALGENWQEIPRTFDERFGYYQRPMPLVPLVWTGIIVALVVGVVVVGSYLGL